MLEKQFTMQHRVAHQRKLYKVVLLLISSRSAARATCNKASALTMDSTSRSYFANYLKLTSQNMHQYFAPREEISVEKNWNLESLLTATISTVIRELETSHGAEVKRNKSFIEAKALTYHLSEAYNNFGVTAFSFDGRSKGTIQPAFVPSTVLGHHLKNLGELAEKLGYRNGILVHLNNLDNINHTEEHLEYLFKAARDYLQIPNIS